MCIRNAAENRMIQIQNGRLHYNWLGQGGEEYPRYSRVRPEFDKCLGELERFLADESLGKLRPTQWEVTYVNHFPKGTVWDDPADWRALFTSLPQASVSVLPVRLESLGGQWHYEIEPQRGRLHVQLQHGRRSSPNQCEVVIMKLTARGSLGKDSDPGLDEGLDLGREVIVRTFKELTSAEAHEYWGLYYDRT